MTHVSAMTTAGLIAAMLSPLAATTSAAHAYLVESFPSAKQRIAKPPKSIRLVFTGTADAHYSTVSLEGEDGAIIAARTQEKADAKLELPAPPLRSGRYRVHYRVLSTDGDVTEGRLDFVVDHNG